MYLMYIGEHHFLDIHYYYCYYFGLQFLSCLSLCNFVYYTAKVVFFSRDKTPFDINSRFFLSSTHTAA